MRELDSLNLVIRILSMALIEIREEGYNVKNSKIYKLSDLVHNVPGQLRAEMVKEKPNYNNIINSLKQRAGSSNVASWIENIENQTSSVSEEE